MEKNKSGFIVHPNWTGDSKYHATYGKNANANLRSFNTKKEAKAYLKRKGVEAGTAKTESGNINNFKTTTVKRRVQQQPRPSLLNGNRWF